MRRKVLVFHFADWSAPHIGPVEFAARLALLHRLDRALAISYFESLAVRRQLAVLNRKTPRPRLHPSDRWFWVLISSFWPDWRDALAIVKPATVIGWTEARSRLKQAETPRPVSSRSTAPAKKNPKRPQIEASRRNVQEMQRIRVFGNDNRPFLLCLPSCCRSVSGLLPTCYRRVSDVFSTCSR